MPTISQLTPITTPAATDEILVQQASGSTGPESPAQILSTQRNVANGVAGTDSANTISGQTVLANGGTTARALAAIASDVSVGLNLTNIAALRALTATQTTPAVIVQSYATQSDQGGGIFVYDSADTASADNGGTIIVDAASRRWHRQYSGAVNVCWFGATTSADATTSITNAVNYCAIAGETVWFGAGTFSISSVIAVALGTSGITIRGEGIDGTYLRNTTTTASIFNFTGSGEVTISDISFEGITSATAGTLLSIGVTCQINRIGIFNYFNGLSLTGNTGAVNSAEFHNPLNATTVGITVNGYGGGLVLDKILMYVPTTVPHAGILIESCGAVQISNSNIIRQNYNLLLIPGNSQVVASVMAINTYFDSAQQNNILIQPAVGGSVVRTYLTQCETSSAAASGIYIDGTNGDVDGILIISAQSNLCTNDGITVTGANAKNIDIMGGQFGQNGGAGISLNASCTNVRITGISSGTGYGLTGNVDGIYIDGTCTNVSLRGSTFIGNTSHQVLDGAGSHIVDCFSSGAGDQANNLPPYGAAALAGSATQVFSGASATLSSEFMPLGQFQTGATGGAIVAVTPGASPYAYTATARGTLFVSGGAVSAVSFTRSGTTIAAGMLGGQYDLVSGDTLTITYTTAPTVNFVPA